MKYCPSCSNLLYPKNDNLICRVCDVEYELTEDVKGGYKNVRKLKEKEGSEEPIIKKKVSEEITEEDRQAYEDHFGTNNS